MSHVGTLPQTYSLHRPLVRLSLALSSVFAWILIAGIFAGDLIPVAFLFVLSAFTTFIVTPLSSRLVGRGLVHTIMIGGALLALAAVMLAFGLSELVPGIGIAGAIGYALTLGLYRAVYWVPYRADAALSGPFHITFFAELVAALCPLFAGYLIALYGGAWVMWFSAAFATLSLFALAGSADVYERFSWNYHETLSALFSPLYRRAFLISVIEGAEAAGLFFVWPLSVYVLTGRNVILTGSIFSITLLGLIGMRLLMRYLRASEVRVPGYIPPVVGVSSWLMRMSAASPLSIILIDAFHGFGRSTRGEEEADYLHEAARYLDEVSALKEMGLALGRGLIGITALFAAYAWGIQSALLTSLFAIAILALAGSFARRR